MRLPSLGPFHEIEGGRSTAAAHAQNLVRSETKLKVHPKTKLARPGSQYSARATELAQGRIIRPTDARSN